MKVIEDAFTIIHIRISGVSLLGISGRHLVTIALVVFIIFNTLRVFTSFSKGNLLSFAESALFIVMTIYFALMWIKAWPKAGKLLNKAGDYESEDFEKLEKNSREK